jgi:hypothetical protein
MGDGIELPGDYAPRRARERLLPWWQGAAGDAVRRWGGVIWPGIPPMVLMAWSITATGPTELGPAPDYVCGLWGVERGRLESLAREASELLGREVPTGLDRRGYLGDLEAQAVCGLLGYKRHLRKVLDEVAPGLAEVLGREPYGAAAARIAAAAYSSGPGAVVPLLDAAPHLVGLPQPKWAPTLGELVALHPGEKIEARGRSVRVRGKWRAAFLILRWEARMVGAVELGRLVLGGERATLAQVEELAALEKWVSSWTTQPGYGPTVARLKFLADGGR